MVDCIAHPILIVEDDCIRCSKIDTQATSTSAKKKKTGRVRTILKPRHLFHALEGLRLAINAT
jgi:hypothetical protein